MKLDRSQIRLDLDGHVIVMIPRAWTRFSNLISFSFNLSVALRCILIFLFLLLMLDTYLPT